MASDTTHHQLSPLTIAIRRVGTFRPVAAIQRRARNTAWLGLLAASVAAQPPPHAVRLDAAASPYVHLVAQGDQVQLYEFSVQTSTRHGFVRQWQSRDGARTWATQPTSVAWVSQCGELLADGDARVLALNEEWLGPLVTSSHDGGASWSQPARVSMNSFDAGARPPLLTKNGNQLVVIWPETRAQGQLWANRSANGGSTWSPVDHCLDAGNGSAVVQSLWRVSHAATTHVVWTTQTPPATWYQRSTDDGTTWLSSPQLLASNAASHCAGSATTLLTIQADGTILRSLDQGLSWQPATGHGNATSVALAVHGDRVLLVGSTTQQPTIHRLCVATDGGLNWTSNPFLLPVFREPRVSASVTADAWFLHYAFQSDPRYQVLGAVVQSDDGLQWRLLTSAAGLWFHATPDGLLAAERSNNFEAWVHVVAGHTSLGSGTPSGSGRAPFLGGRHWPGPGRQFDLTIDSAPGGTPGILLATFAAPRPTPYGAGTLYLESPLISVGILTSGAPGLPGIGTARTPITVPNDAAMSGYCLRSQAVLLDLTTMDGWCLSQARESWIQ